ncbi:sulfurtransferase [Salinigranum rubrum]|uniref:Sulfurtransferase n=1 Tax=Salinigranum rubrum TaxID=755307 RepID=A0A2I8VPF2_9EURY|nr:sulfurtransferase [Salinigranum rubrum]AUV83807.1 sulfurtransferase [Salinigranum rubrum]
MTDIVVSAAWLADHLDEVRVVDVRDDWEFDGIGHVPGAVNVPFDSFRAEEHAVDRGGDPAEGMLPGVEAWEEVLSEAGITPDDTLVVYDDTHGVFAARFLVTALAYGHETVHLLDGDFSAWSRDHEVERGESGRAETEYAASKAEDSPFVGFETVQAALEDDDVAVLDTREPHEWEEGHLPGAVQLDWRELVDDDSRGLKPDDELEAILADHGVDREKRVLLYCNTARRISHTYVVLRHLGYEDVMFYEGSLTEWEARGAPLESA